LAEGGDAAAAEASFPNSTDAAESDASIAHDAGSTGLDGSFDADATSFPSSDGGACALDHTYSFGFDGGFVVYRDQATLSPPAVYTLTRTRYEGDSGPTSRTCMAALAGCEAGDASTRSVGGLLAACTSAV
jgi:hypothetical protein